MHRQASESQCSSLSCLLCYSIIDISTLKWQANGAGTHFNKLGPLTSEISCTNQKFVSTLAKLNLHPSTHNVHANRRTTSLFLAKSPALKPQ